MDKKTEITGNLVTIKVSGYINELSVAKSYLEENGIICFLQDELINRMYPVAAGGFGGVKLQVPEEEADRARELLVEGGFSRKEDYMPSESDKRLMNIVEWLQSLFSKKK